MAEQKLGVTIVSSLTGDGFEKTRTEAKKTQTEVSASAQKIAADYQESFEKVRNESAVALAAIGAAAGFAIKEAVESVSGMDRARAIVEANGKSWDVMGAQVEAAASKIQETTRFTDEQAVDAFNRLTLITGESDLALQSLNATTGLAALMNIDLGTASGFVANIMEGNLGRITRLIPELKNMEKDLGANATEADRLAYFMDKAGTKLAKLAEEDAKTAEGQLLALKKQSGEAAESFGKALLPSVLGVTGVLTNAAKATSAWANEHPALITNVGGLTISALALTTGVSTLAVGVTKLWGLFTTGGALIATTTGGIVTLTAAAVGLGAALWIAHDGQEALAAKESSAAVQTANQWIAYNRLKTQYGATRYEMDLLRQTAAAHNVPIKDAVSKVEDLTIRYGNVTQALNAWIFSFRPATDGLAALNTEIKTAAFNSQGFLDLMNAGLTATEAIANMKNTPVTATVDVAIKTPEEFGPAYDPIQASKDKSAAEKAEAGKQKEIYRDLVDYKRSQTVAFENAYSTAVESMVDADMTGQQRREAIWNSFKMTAIRQIADVTRNEIFGAMARSAANQTAAATAIGASTAAAAVEKQSALSVMVAWLQAAYAKLTMFYAWSGPFAPVLALGTMGAALAAMAGLAGKVMKMEQGGIVPGYGFGDKVPAMLSPGEKVIPANEVRNGGTSQGGNTFHFHINADRETGFDTIQNIKRIVQEQLPDMIANAILRGKLNPAMSY